MAILGGSTPKQGDHVFNDLESGILRPFRVVSSIGCGNAPGHPALSDYMHVGIDDAKRLFRRAAYTDARRLVSHPSVEADILKVLNPRRRQYGRAELTLQKLRDTHHRNASQFGSRLQEYTEAAIDCFLAVLTAAIDKKTHTPGISAVKSTTVSLRGCALVHASFDPATALVLLVSTGYAEKQQALDKVLVLADKLADSIVHERPMEWSPVVRQHGLDQTTGAGRAATTMAEMWDFFRELEAYLLRRIYTFALGGLANPDPAGRNPDSWVLAYEQAIAELYQYRQQLRGRRV